MTIWVASPYYNGITNKLCGRRVRPTRYSPVRVQEPNFIIIIIIIIIRQFIRRRNMSVKSLQGRRVTILHRPLKLAVAADSMLYRYQFWSWYAFPLSRYDTLSVSLLTLTFDILTLKQVRINARMVGNLSTNFWDIAFSTYGPPVRRIICDMIFWPWRSWRLSVIRIFFLHQYIKLEVRRPFPFGSYDALPVSVI